MAIQMDCSVALEPLRSISIYESRSVILISGHCSISKRYLILEIKRSLGSSDVRHEMVIHPETYSVEAVNALVVSLKCVRVISDAFCIFGFVQLVESCYIVVVTKASSVANLHGHNVFTITDTNILPITYKVRNTMDESRYKSILQNLNLANNHFYFSYTYDLTESIQQNFILAKKSESSNDHLESKFVWNHHAMNYFTGYDTGERNSPGGPSKDSHLRMDRWLVPVIHGYLKQTTIRLATGDTFKITLVARRSRFFAGTRYLRRGVDSEGYTANEVETEQIVTKQSDTANPCYRSSSLTQLRGSIPLYWHHTNVFVPSPDIKVNELDYGYHAALLHFDMLKKSFGDNITVLNLVRTHNSGREVTVGTAFEELMTALNQHYQNHRISKDKIEDDIVSAAGDKSGDNKVKYIAFDFHGTPHSTLFSKLDLICQEIFPNSGFYLQASIYEEDAEMPESGSESGNGNGGDKRKSPQYVTWPFDNEASKVESSLPGLLERRNLTAAFTEENYSNNPIDNLLNQKSGITNAANHCHTTSTSEKKKGSRGMGLGVGVGVGFLQMGVLRTNCVDCLDRTNVAQFCYARQSLFQQLKCLGALRC